MRTGNKLNAFFNQEYAKHVRRWTKKYTSHLRRRYDKLLIRERLAEKN